MNNKEEAQKILEAVGGKKNINRLTHCVTRLRFNLKDAKKADKKTLQELPSVLEVHEQAEEFQVVIGTKVGKIYQEIMNIDGRLGESNGSTSKGTKGKKSFFSNLIETLSAILIPSLPPVIGGGMIKGFIYMFWEFNWLSMESNTFIILNLISDVMFYFYPFLLAVSAAKRFKTNEYMALSLAGALMYPAIINSVTDSGPKALDLFGFISIPYIDYSSSVIPIILSVWIMSYVFRFFEKRIPDLISTIFTPMLTLLIAIPVELVALAPLGFYIGEYIAKGMQILIDFSPVLSGFIIGATRPFLVLTGTHHAMRAIVQQQISTYGYTTIGAMNYMSVIAQAAAALGVYLVVRNKKMKNISFSSAISGFLGVTEPALYGVIIKYKVVMLATMLGGGIAAAITATFGSAEYAMVMSSLITIPATFGKGFIGIVIGIPVAFLVTIAVIFLGRKSINRTTIEDEVDEQSDEQTLIDSANKKNISLKSPVEGNVKPIETVADKTFSNEILGKSVAIDSAANIVKSPIAGKITAMFPTNHAIGITSPDGIEILIHVGVDTVKLNGKYFTAKVSEGDSVAAGDELLFFDKAQIEAAGYDSVVIIVVTNAQDFLDIIKTSKSAVTANDTILDVIK